MKIVKSHEFWFGVGAALVILKFGPSLPVVGPFVSKIKV
jgi:hypothetical protein